MYVSPILRILGWAFLLYRVVVFVGRLVERLVILLLSVYPICILVAHKYTKDPTTALVSLFLSRSALLCDSFFYSSLLLHLLLGGSK